MDLNNLGDLLKGHGVEPKKCLVMRHAPQELGLHERFPELVARDQSLFEAYQSAQKPWVEDQLKKADWIASFFGMPDPARAVFIGLYRIVSKRSLSLGELWELGRVRELAEEWGMDASGYAVERVFFKTQRVEEASQFKGKLYVEWPERGGRPFVRLASTLIDCRIFFEEISFFDQFL